MARSVKKGPYIDERLLGRIEAMNRSGEKRVTKTWARACTISPEFVGHTVAVHNGNKFIPVYVTENMVGHKLGEMEARAVSKRIRMSARKMRLVIDQIRHADVNEAYSILQFSKKGAAEPIDKALRSAVANAVDKADQQGEVLDVDDLYVKEAYVNEGPTLRRYRAAGMGRASPLRKRMSHVTVVVDTKE